jgi:hypothetical protein
MHRLGSLTISRARLIFLFVFTLASVFGVAAQSSDAEAPTPLTSEEIAGRIAPRDVGDPRRTTYFYLFKGTPGDIALDVESQNLDGNIDLYLADGLRPLTQVVLVGGDEVSRAAKSVFLRRAEALILRVRARSIGDADGTFRIRFSGAFAPADAALIAKYTKTTAPPVVTAKDTSGARRVTATGALIRTPAPSNANAVASNNETKTSNAPTANTSSAQPGETTRATNESVSNQSSTVSPAASNATIGANNSRGETPAVKNAASSPTSKDVKPQPTASTSAKTARNTKARTKPKTSNNSTARTSTVNNSANTSASNSANNSTNNPKSSGAAASPSNATNAARTIGAQTARLILEMRDGTRYERMMISIERVTVENGNLLVITKDGQRIRHPLVDVVRMSIEP